MVSFELRVPSFGSADRNPKLETRNAEPETRNTYSWATSEGGVIIERRGLRVLVLEGIPAGDISADLLDSFWG